jgi:hypothetical protein
VPPPMSMNVFGSVRIGVGADALNFKVILGVASGNQGTSSYLSFTAIDHNGIGIAELIKYFSKGKPTESLPELIESLPRIKTFYILYGSGQGLSEFKIIFDTQIRLHDKKEVELTLIYDSRKNNTASSRNESSAFSGILEVGRHTFQVKFVNAKTNGQANSLYLLASYKSTDTINIKEFTSAISPEIDSYTPDISFRNVSTFLLYSKEKNVSRILFGIGAGTGDFDLKKLPLVGQLIEKEKSFNIDEISLILSNSAFTAAELKSINGVDKILPESDMALVNIFINATIAGKKERFSLIPKKSVAQSKQQTDVQKPSDPTPVKPQEKALESIPGSVSSLVKWINVRKKLGPLDLQRIGVAFTDGKLIFLLDASVSISVLSIQLMGLGLGFELQWPIEVPSFYIDGMGLSFKKDPIEISGAFLRGIEKVTIDNQIIEVTSYSGAARIKAAGFGISGIGSYAQYPVNGVDQTSFFIYAVFEGAIGGPAFFFVTGIAAGFGYNRTVNIPPIENVNRFPLVAMALNPDPLKTLSDILIDLINLNAIPISPGDYWFAIGIKFTTFKVLDSFILLVVKFGNRLEFAILGLSILKWPEVGITVVYIELAVVASFGPESEVIAVRAIITKNSWVFTKDCKLAGGFAMFIWISGEHAGDFVVTLGGYHPKFVKPEHYPAVDRLSLNWIINSSVYMKGELYFALTSSSIMAGGMWNVNYDFGFIKASLIIRADMIISWAPFYYEIEAAVRVRIEANIEALGVQIRYRLEMSANLHICGPPFAGSVNVNWIILSFTIPFGDDKQRKPDPLEWNEFRNSFIPADKKGLIKPVLIIITDGIIEEHKNEKGEIEYITVNPHKLKVKVDSVIPIKDLQADLKNSFKGLEKINFEKYYKAALGIRPMGIRELESILEVGIKPGNSDNAKSELFELSCYSKSVPESLWSSEPNNSDSTRPKQPKMIENALGGLLFQSRKQLIPEGTPEFNVNGKYEVQTNNLIWEYDILTTGPDNNSYTDSSVNPNEIIRNKLKGFIGEGTLNIINETANLNQFDITNETVQFDKWKHYIDILHDDPVIAGIGQIPQYKSEKGHV